jgi:hypothetical protein
MPFKRYCYYKASSGRGSRAMFNSGSFNVLINDMGIQQILLFCGMVAGPLFVVVFLIEGSLRSGYDVMRQPVSALAIGKRGWVQRTNFILVGILMFAYAFGLDMALAAYGGSFWIPFLVGLYAVGLIGAGIFVTDKTGIPSKETAPKKRDVGGTIHDLCSLIVFIPLFIACFVFANLFAVSGSLVWHIYSVATGILFGIGFILFAKGFARNEKFAGLLQRLTIAIGWIWLALIAAHLLALI